jgi:hypothetical protein
VTTTDEVMPTLREIETGLRERLAELSRVRDDERAKRERARMKVEDEAISAGNNNSIGESLDELLIELGLHGRPRDVSQLITVEVRQTVPPSQVRDIYVGGSQVYGAYNNIIESCLYTTFDIGLSVMVPRDHDGCACDIAISDEMMESHLGRMPAGVEVVDTTVKWCGYNAYPYTTDANMESRCRNYRTAREQEKADAHDFPTVQECKHAHSYIEPHRHIFYRNGDVTYSVRADYEPDPPSVTVPGWYGSGTQVGQPVPGTPGEYNAADPNRVLPCSESGHPHSLVHAHWRREGATGITYTRDLYYVSNDGATRIPGIFSRDIDRVGNLHTD